jgi:hypothetical protein
MSKFDENLFGRIAVFKDYLTWEQLEECLKVQRSQSPTPRLGEVLLQKGYLGQEQLQTILEIRRKKVRKLLRDPQEVRDADRAFGALALKAGFISLEDLETAILEQERLARLSLHFRLGEVLVSKSFMEVKDVLEILRHQGKRIVLCPVCDSHFNVIGFREGRKYRCLKCQAELMEPKFLDTVAVDGFIEDEESGSREAELAEEVERR